MADEIAVELRIKNAQLANDLRKATTQINALKKSMVEMGNSGATAMNKVSVSANKAAKSLSGMATVLKAVAAYSAGQAILGSLKTWSDYISVIQSANNQLASLGGTLEETARIQQATLQIANQVGVSYADTATTVARLSRALEEFGGTQDQAVIIADTLNKALLLTGATGAEATSTLIQFSQALQSGILQGDELRSLRENAPSVVRAIADELGIATSQIKKAGEEGKITTEVLANALLKANEKLTEQTAEIPLTLGRSLTVVSNNIADFVSNSAGLTAFLEELSAAVFAAGELFIKIAGDISSTDGSFDEATQNVTGLTSVFDLLTTAVGGVVKAFYTFGKGLKLVLDIAYNTFKALSQVIGVFAASSIESLRNLGDLIYGVFTLDAAKISQALAASRANSANFYDSVFGAVGDAMAANKQDLQEFADGVVNVWSTAERKVKKISLSPEGAITGLPPTGTSAVDSKKVKEDTSLIDEYNKALKDLRATQLSMATETEKINAAYDAVIQQIERYQNAAIAAGQAVDQNLISAVANAALDEQEKQLKALETAWTDLTVVLDEAGLAQKAQNDLWLQFVDVGTKAGKSLADIQHAFDTFLVDTENAEKLAEIKTSVDDIGEAFYSAAESMIFDAENVGDAMKQLAVEVGKLILKFLVLKAIQAATGGLGLGSAVTGGGEVALPGAAAYGSGGATVRIYNNSGGLVTTRRRGNDTDIIIGQMAAAVSRGGNQFDRAMRRAYGLGRAGI